MALLLLLALAVSAGSAGAADDPPQVGVMTWLWTRHVNPGSDTNDRSRFLGLGYRDWYAAAFVNSYDDFSVFGGRKFDLHDARLSASGDFFLRFKGYAGLLYGYDEVVLIPVLLPTLNLGYASPCCGTWGLELIYVPTLSGGVFMNLMTWEGDLFGAD